MAIIEVDPSLGLQAEQEFSERYYEDLELMRAREITERTYSPQMLERILPFFSAADALVEQALVVYDKDHPIKTHMGQTFITGWMSVLNKTTEHR